MKNRTFKKMAAAVMAVALIGSGISAPAADKALFGSVLTANAAENDDYDTAVFDEETGVLTLNGKVNREDIWTYRHDERVKKVICAEGTVFPANSAATFSFIEAAEIDLTNADTSNVVDMSYMFDNCPNLKSLDLSMLNTSKVTTMRCMFMGNELTSVNLKNFDTSKVSTMYGMFWECKNLKSLDLSSFDTSNVTDMSYMFEDCLNLASLDICNFNTSKVTDMEFMFEYCESLTSLDVSSFDTSNVLNARHMFCNCKKLSSIDLTGFDLTRATNAAKADHSDHLYRMLDGCEALYPDIMHVLGQSVTLGGSIGVNFIICKNSYYRSSYPDNVAKAVLSGPNGDVVITDLETYKQPDGKYKFTYSLNATQAASDVTIKFYDENDKQLILCRMDNCDGNYSLSSFSQATTSLNNYFADVKETTEYKNDPVTTIMVNTLENYCKAAENYFKGTKNTVNKVSEQFAVILDNYAPTIASGTDIKLSLILDSETAVRIYTNGSGVKIDGQAVTPYMSKYGKCYEIANIPAHQLINTHTLTVDGMEYTFSPMSYVYRVMNSESPDKLREAAWAVFLYATAADEYNKK